LEISANILAKRVDSAFSSSDARHLTKLNAETSLNGLNVATALRIFDLITFKVYAELKAEAQRSYLGLIWWIAEPLLFMTIFYFVFDVLFARDIPNFLAFLLTGLTMWHWMQSTVVQCGNSIIGNRPIIQQVVVPKAVFPATLVLANFVKFLVVLLIMVGFLLVYGIPFSWGWLYCAPVLLTAILLVSGLGFLLASILPLFPDIRVLVDNGFRAIFFLSGIFYDIDSLAPKVSEVLAFNPFAVLISSLRAALLHGSPPAAAELIWIASISLVCLAAGLVIMRRMKSSYAKALI
jgi:lipopolysaccharide transport system permease protein